MFIFDFLITQLAYDISNVQIWKHEVISQLIIPRKIFHKRKFLDPQYLTFMSPTCQDFYI